MVTDDPGIARKARLIRNHGEGVAEASWPDDELVNVVGMNFRLTELQAAVAIGQLRHLDERNAMRRDNYRVPPRTHATIPTVGATQGRSRGRHGVLHLEVALPAAGRRPGPGDPRAGHAGRGNPACRGLCTTAPRTARSSPAGSPYAPRRPVRPTLSRRAFTLRHGNVPALGSDQRAVPLVYIRAPAQQPERYGRRRQGIRKGLEIMSPESRAETHCRMHIERETTSWKDAARHWLGRAVRALVAGFVHDESHRRLLYRSGAQELLQASRPRRGDAKALQSHGRGQGRQPELLLGGHGGCPMARGAATAVSGPAVLRGVSQGSGRMLEQIPWLLATCRSSRPCVKSAPGTA